LSLFYITRSFNVKNLTDISSIIDPPKGATLLEKNYYSEFWLSLGIRQRHLGTLPNRIIWNRFHLTCKSGPNGHALWNSMSDFKLIKDSLIFKYLRDLGGQLFSTILMDLNICFSLLPSILFTGKAQFLRKLVSFPDKEGKVRVIAILDYFSQTVLYPLHSYLFRMLSRIPQDCTFNQSKFIELTKDWKYFYSYDLTAATDRFPINLISNLLSERFGQEYVASWKSIMVSLPFHFRGKDIFYNVGNPMGAYSSWSSFSLTHHYILFWCCKELDIEWSISKYCLLGDDILIGDHRLAKLYYDTITFLGIEISLHKSHQSHKLFEFAKRNFLLGIEISPFPIASLEALAKHPSSLSSCFMDLKERGWEWSNEIDILIKDFYQSVLQRSSSNSTSCSQTGYISNLMINFMRGTIPAEDCLNAIIRRHNLPLPELSNYQSISILSGTALEVFMRDNPLDYKEGKPLGELAFNLTLYFSEWYDSFKSLSPTFEVSHIPLLNAHGHIEDSYMRLSNEAYLIDTIGEGLWPTHLRNLALPSSDEIYYERTVDTLTKVSSILGTEVLKNLRQIRSSDL
jgi:hypothetical protein